MGARHWLLVVVFLALSQPAQAAEKPSELIVGRWRIRDDRRTGPVETFEFGADGKGQVSKTDATKTDSAVTSWTITDTFGNTCIVKITYDGAPSDVKPLMLLLAFDGSDTAIFQARTDRITYLDRQKTP